MAEPSPRAPFAVNLEEFERRLRGPVGPSGTAAVDPLAALAQLVGDEGRSPASRQGLFSAGAEARPRETARPAPAAPVAKAPSVQQNFAEQLRALQAHHEALRQALVEGRPLDSREQDEDQPANAASHLSEADYQLRGFEESFAAAGVGTKVPHASENDWGHEPLSAHPQDERPSVYAATAVNPPLRRHKPMAIMGAIMMVGFLVLGASFVFRHARSGVLSGQVPLIKADSAPVRVVPAKPEGVVIANQNTDILDSGRQKVADAANLAKDKVVANQEQPDDLNALPKSTATAPATGTPQVTSAVVAPPAAAGTSNPQAQPISGADTAANSAPNTSADVHKVRTVLVEPDATLGPAAAGSARAARGFGALAMPAGAKSASLETAKPAKPVAASPQAHRVVVHHGAEVHPARLVKPAPKPKLDLRKLAAAPLRNAPLQLVPSHDSARNKPRQVASLAQPASAGGGFFAVQLAAPGTEAGAKTMMTRLAARYGSALQGHHLGYHRMSVNGHDVYRVRVDHVGRVAALSICKAIRAKGGSCWISAN